MAEEGDARRRVRPWLRLGGGLAITGVLLLSVPLAIRWSGMRTLRATVERHRAEGLGALPGDALLAAPDPDPEARKRLLAAETALGRARGPDPASKADEWIVGASHDVPTGVAEWIDQWRKPVEERTAILRQGRIGPGAVPPPAGAGTPTYAEATEGRVELWTASRLAHRWRRIAAAFEDDPVPHIEALDAEVRATRAPVRLREAWSALEARTHRDVLHLDAALRGDLPREREDAWCAEIDETAALLAAGFRQERLWCGGALAAEFLEGRPVGPGILGEHPALLESLDLGVHGPADCADYLDRLAALEAWLGGGPPPPDPGEPGSTSTAPTGVGPQALVLFRAPYDATILRAGIEHRARRLVARLVRVFRERGRLPADGAEFRAWLGADGALLDGGPRAFRLIYETTQDGCVRIRPDRAPPLPDVRGATPYLLQHPTVGPARAPRPAWPVGNAGAYLRLVAPAEGK